MKKSLRSKDDIPEEGSLPLLALGYQGLMLWRQKRLQFETLDSEKMVGAVINGKEVKIYTVGDNEEE